MEKTKNCTFLYSRLQTKTGLGREGKRWTRKPNSNRGNAGEHRGRRCRCLIWERSSATCLAIVLSVGGRMKWEGLDFKSWLKGTVLTPLERHSAISLFFKLIASLTRNQSCSWHSGVVRSSQISAKT